MTICPNCNTDNQPGVLYCSTCGAVLQATPVGSAPESAPIRVEPPLSGSMAYTPPPAPPPYAQAYTPPPASPQMGYLPPPQMPPAYSGTPTKTRSVALLLEILPGLFGLLGIGWLYAGKVGTGIILLIGMIIWDLGLVAASVITGGIGCVCGVISLVLIAVSAILLNNYAGQHPEVFKA